MIKKLVNLASKGKQIIKYSDSIFSKIIFRSIVNDNIEIISGKVIEDFYYSYLLKFDKDFWIPLSDRVDLEMYSQKLSKLAITFIIVVNGEIAGLISGYFYDEVKKEGFITLVHTIDEFRANHIATFLHQELVGYSKILRFTAINLIVSKENLPALNFYLKCGYRDIGGSKNRRKMKLIL